MLCLSDIETKAWLSSRQIPDGPYHSRECFDRHYVQFHAPREHHITENFIRHFLGVAMQSEEILIQLTDWALYQPSEMLAIQALRSVHGEEMRRLIDSPGHLIQPNDSELSVAFFSLTVSNRWSSYLYLQSGSAILYNWEGEIFDFWTTDEALLAKLEDLITTFRLTKTGG